MKYTHIKTTTILSSIPSAILGVGITALVCGSIATTVLAANTSMPASTTIRSARMNAMRLSSTTRLRLVARLGSTTERMGSTTAHMSSTTRQAMLTNRQNQAIGLLDNKSVQEISTRVSSLNALTSRLDRMKNLSATEQSTLSGEITTLIGELTGLQAKIQADASSTAVGTVGALASSSPLRQDFTSITKDYRVYMLVIPQTQILAAADRVNTLVTSLTTLSAKIQSRLASSTANTAVTGATSASLQATLADLNAKVADASAQATAAVAAVSNLLPDNGVTSVAASNTTALKTAQTDIKTATKDIQTADKDAHTIVSAIEKK